MKHHLLSGVAVKGESPIGVFWNRRAKERVRAMDRDEGKTKAEAKAEAKAKARLRPKVKPRSSQG